MKTALAKRPGSGRGQVAQEPAASLPERVKEFIGASVAENTKRGYASDFRAFCAWCGSAGVSSLPADPVTVADYFAHLAQSGRRASTVERAKAAIKMAHDTAGYDSPTLAPVVKTAVKGIRRRIGVAKAKKAPTLTVDVRAMIAALPDTLAGKRDCALLLIGFAGAFRRSELAALRVEDVTQTTEGVRILLPRSKTDQEGEGRFVGIKRGANPATCPVRALADWLAGAGITSGPVFRAVGRYGTVKAALSAQSVALIVKRAAAAAGLDPAAYAGHSLRAGFVTQGALNGATEANIMRQTGHKSSDTVRGYVRIANVFKDNASGLLGL